MNTIITKGALTAAISSLCLLACGANSVGTPEGEAAKVASTTEGLGEDACANGVPPQVQLFGGFYQSGPIAPTYGSSACPSQFVLEMDAVPGPPPGQEVAVSVGPATPVSQDLCATTDLSLYTWGFQNGTFVPLGSVVSKGAWIGNQCIFGPPYNTTQLTYLFQFLPSYNNYRIAASALQHPANKSAALDVEVPISVVFTHGIPPRHP